MATLSQARVGSALQVFFNLEELSQVCACVCVCVRVTDTVSVGVCVGLGFGLGKKGCTHVYANISQVTYVRASLLVL